MPVAGKSSQHLPSVEWLGAICELCLPRVPGFTLAAAAQPGPLSPGQEGSGASHLFHSLLRVPTHGVLTPGRAARGSQRSRERAFSASQGSKHSQAAAIHFLTLGTPELEGFPDRAELLRGGWLWHLVRRFPQTQKLLETQQSHCTAEGKSLACRNCSQVLLWELGRAGDARC